MYIYYKQITSNIISNYLKELFMWINKEKILGQTTPTLKKIVLVPLMATFRRKLINLMFVYDFRMLYLIS